MTRDTIALAPNLCPRIKCQHPGCNKQKSSSTSFCKKHAKSAPTGTAAGATTAVTNPAFNLDPAQETETTNEQGETGESFEGFSSAN